MVHYAKGEAPRNVEYAKGGGQLGRTREFLKEPVEFRRGEEGMRKNADNVGVLADEDQRYGKSGDGKGTGCAGGTLTKRTGDKCLTPIKPRS